MILRVLLSAETPLSFRAGRNPARSETLPYIPGTALMGSLAQAHQLLGRDRDEFAAFFLQDHIFFGNCYQANFDKKRLPELTGEDRPVLPLPATARSCKRFSGFAFAADRNNEMRKGVRDTLIPLALFALSGETTPEVLSEIDIHPVTKYPLDRISGFFRRGAKATQYGQPAQPTAIRTRTGINYATGTAQSEVLYSRQTLPEHASFWGRWWIDDQVWDAFEAFITQALEQDLIRMGNNRTRGFGRVSLNVQAVEMDTREALHARVEDFTNQFKVAAQQANIATPAPVYVPITLTSDAILYDPLLRARLRVTSDDLNVYGLPGATLIFHAADTRQIAGWSELWGLPKADDWAIRMGSVFLFALPHAEDTTFEHLLHLQEQGIGVRRAEGFGMVSIANLFHTELTGGVFA